MKPSKIILPIVILCIGLFVMISLVNSKAKPKKAEDPPIGAAIETVVLTKVQEPIKVIASGIVQPAQQVALSPEVAARVRKVHPDLVPGGIVSANQKIVWLDGVDYQLAVQQQLAQVDNALTQFELEKSRAASAKEEWELIGGDKSASALTLRKPQLRTANVALKSAKSGLKIARRNAGKTLLKAPFNAQVQSEMIDPGQLVSPGMQMAILVGTDAYWVQVSVPMEALKRIKTGANGSAVSIVQTVGTKKVTWQGVVIRKLPDLDRVGRMARVLIEVNDPLELTKPEEKRRSPSLLINDFVEVEIDAGSIADVVKIPRLGVHEGKTVYIALPDNTLKIADLEIEWRSPKYIYASSGVDAGEELIVTPIATPVPGLKLRRPNVTAGAAASTPKSTTTAGSPQ